jgi:type VI secretion system protein ImpM
VSFVFNPDFIGFYGKLPSRGDFVVDAVPRACVDEWDAWARAALYAGRAALGECWTERWMAAPIWRFQLPPGICGNDALIGAFLPSIDKVGRQFPLLVVAGAADPVPLAQGGIWLEAAVDQAVAAITQDLSPEALAMGLRGNCAEGKLPAPGWWTEGGPYRAASHEDWTGLPAAQDFAAMISDVGRVLS